MDEIFSRIKVDGRQVAIVGPTVSGKTTLVNLPMRSYRIDVGEIVVDGLAARQMT